MKYLGIYLVNSQSFKCSIHEAKRSFCRSANEIFGKIGRFAPDDVTLQLIQSKWLPALLYGRLNVSATAVAFFGMVLITSVRRQMSRRTACHRCGKVDRIPRLCSSMNRACHLNKADLNSLDFAVNRFFMKLLSTNNIHIVQECQQMFHFELLSEHL